MIFSNKHNKYCSGKKKSDLQLFIKRQDVQYLLLDFENLTIIRKFPENINYIDTCIFSNLLYFIFVNGML